MTWIDNNGDVRPQSWEEYCELAERLPWWMSGTWPVYYSERKPVDVVAALLQTALRAAGADLPEKRIRRTKRVRLWLINPYCFWCGCLTVVDVDKPIRQRDAATIDHLYSRLHPKRRLYWDKYVLACYQCNIQRSHHESTGSYFMPKLQSRINIARETCATLARQSKLGVY